MEDLFVKRVEALSPERRKLLARMRAHKPARVSTDPILRRRIERDVNPLSFAQERMWFLQRLAPNSCAYHCSSPVRLIGRINVAVLRQSLIEVIKRHEVLRTVFPECEGLPVQLVNPTASLNWTMLNVGNLPEAKKEIETRRLAILEARRPFDLARGPLIRAILVRLNDEEHALLLTMHHIIADGWSTGVLVRELTALYGAFASGKPSPLAELPIQYPDFADWQRQWLQGDVLEKQLSYWKEQLADLPVLQLSTDRPRPAMQSHRGATHMCELSEPLTASLVALSKGEGVTLYMTLLAAFKVLLYGYTGQEDLVVGTPVANRNRVEVEALIGFFVNKLVLRTPRCWRAQFSAGSRTSA